jgi:hypothetical protein
MENRLARIISILFHPLLFPSYALLTLFGLNLLVVVPLNLTGRIYLLSIIFFFTFLLPITSVIILHKLKFSDSILLNSRRERIFPLILTIISYFALFYLLSELHVPNTFLYLIYGAIVSLIAGFIITLFWKISLHMIGWGAFSASFVGISVKMLVDIHWVLIAAILISGIVGYSRLKLDSHNPAQVYSGYSVGFILIMIMTFAF